MEKPTPPTTMGLAIWAQYYHDLAEWTPIGWRIMCPYCGHVHKKTSKDDLFCVDLSRGCKESYEKVINGTGY